MSAFDAVDGSSTGTGVPWMWVPIRPHDSEEPSHASDYDHRSRIAKSVFQVHAVDAKGNVVLRRQIKRR
jgi:hypothetical protein